MFFTPLSSWYC